MKQQIIERFPGIGCAWADAAGKVTTEYHGFADRESRTAVDENTVFPACSISKLITAICVMKLHERKRIDIGTFDVDYGTWAIYAVTRNSDGVLTLYQGHPDGNLYWIAENASAIKIETGMPFWIGQDGTGKCIVSLAGRIDDFAMWTRPLTRNDIRAIFDAGKKGDALSALLAE